MDRLEEKKVNEP